MTNARLPPQNADDGEVDQQQQQQQQQPEQQQLLPPRAVRLDELPLEILLHIFDYCHAFDLVRLSAVCTRFNDIARDEMLWYRRSNLTLVTNQVSKRFRSRYIECYLVYQWKTVAVFSFGSAYIRI